VDILYGGIGEQPLHGFFLASARQSHFVEHRPAFAIRDEGQQPTAIFFRK